jgi:hypothetical protein
MPAPTAPPTQTSTPPRRWPYVTLPVLFLLGALTGPAYYLYATSVPVIGANIGAGLALMWTAGWGLPWSLVPWNASGSTAQDDFVAFTACALFNVILIAGLSILLYRRSARTRSTAVTTPGGQEH